ncbi:MAG: helix-turn-helix transcriptional regulator [Lachnospiraceae bacterium]|nr:helix-turn-helix transcriptional regulator [Lachnospiraceae bacterium]
MNKLTAGERIMVLRNDRGYTREQLAELADISDKFLYEIETGKKGFSAITLMNLSKALEVSLDYIMTGTGSRKYNSEIAAAIEKFKPDTLEQVDRILKAAYEISKEEK